VVVKLNSETITHKSDVGGVVLNVRDAEGVKAAFEGIKANIERLYPGECAKHFLGVSVQPMLEIEKGYEVLLGMNSDPQFGPVVVFGTGGKLVEVYKDSSLILPPFTRPLARRCMERTKIFKALKGVRGQGPVNMEQLESLLVAFGDLAVYHPLIKEIDINPLFVSEGRICAIDARVVLWPKDTPLEKIPQPAIRPYPQEYVQDAGNGLCIRPLESQDTELWKEWCQRLCPECKCKCCHEAFVQDLHTEFSQQLLFAGIHDKKIVGCVRVRVNPSNPIEAFYEIITDKDADKQAMDKVVSAALEAAKKEKLHRLIAECPKCECLSKKLAELGFKEQDGKMVLNL